MMRKEEQEQELLQRTLDSLELTEHNRQLADHYLDLSGPEDPELLKDAVWTRLSEGASIIRS